MARFFPLSFILILLFAPLVGASPTTENPSMKNTTQNTKPQENSWSSGEGDAFIPFLFASEELRWRKSLTRVFTRLFPQFLPSSKLQCSFPEETLENNSPLLFSQRKHYVPGIEIEIFFDSQPNAFAIEESREHPDFAKILLSSGLLKKLETDAELAFVLAHEMAHIQLKHFRPQLAHFVFSDAQLKHLARVHQDWENTADAQAMTRVALAGYSMTDAVLLLTRLSSFESSTNSPHRNHPSIQKRKELLLSLR